MLLLALDTSTRQASVALCNEKCLYGEYTWQVGNKHSVELLACIQRLSTECSIPLAELDGLAVAIGPGSFNGVRVAVSVAKTLAFALRKPLIGISSLEIAAAQFPHWPGPICSLLEAGRSELYAGCYQFAEPGHEEDFTASPHQLGDYQLFAPEELALYLQDEIAPTLLMSGNGHSPAYLFCGEVSEASRLALARHMSDPVSFAPALQSARRSSTLAHLAYQRFMEKRLDDPLLLEPLYLRRPSITTSARKQPLLGKGTGQIDQQNDQHSTEREEGALRH